jgi:serine protease Do
VTPDLGLHLAGITAGLRDLYKLSANQAGVVVTGVEPLSPADDRGLREGEVIVDVQTKPVHTPSDLLQGFNILRQQGKHYVLTLVQNQNSIRSVALPLNGG